ncbi:MAG: cell division protein FtsL [Deltaproteobacteria bacterium]|nr:cell division protein FtsL [Deltaproteobacteria bacterium]MBN2673865.1 cell division protein FtsL [Deltaproteobacteria bacterium]
MNRRIQKAVPSGRPAFNRPKIKVKMPPVLRSSVQKRKAPQSGENVTSFSTPSYKGVGLPYILFVILSMLVAAGGIIYHLHVRFEGVRLGYEASEQRKIQTRLMLKRRELRLELASMKEPGRIEDEAREKLGMETPKSEEFVHINKKKKVVSVSGGAL